MAGSINWDLFARDHASAVFDKLGRKVGDTEGRFSKFKKGAVVAGALAGGAIIKFAADSMRAYASADKSQRVLEDAYKRFPKLADVNIAALRAQADAIQAKTGFDNDEINASQGRLAAYKLTGKQIQDLTPLLVDYAARTGKDLPEASAVLGKALLGQGRSLKDVGIKFKDTGTVTGNLAELMSGLRGQLGGFAEKEGKTAEGKAAILSRKMDDFKEAVGTRLMPVLSSLLDWLNKFADWIKNHQQLTKDLVVTVLALAGAFKALALANAAANAVAEANPYVRLATGLAIVAAALIYAYKHTAGFQIIVHQTVDNIVADFKFLVRAAYNVLLYPFLTVLSAILHGAAIAFSWIPGLNTKLNHARDAFDRFKDQVNKIIDEIINGKSVVIGVDAKEAKREIARVKALLASIYDTTHYLYLQTVYLNPKGSPFAGRAVGGPVSANTTYMVGERGPELFMPNRSGTIIPNNRTRTMTGSSGGSSGGGDTYINEVHVHGVQSTSQLFQELQKYAKRNGSIKLSGVTAS